MDKVTVIGVGLAGCEAAWQLVKRKTPVRLVGMQPKTPPPAHHSENSAELVCSNSLRSDSLDNAVRILKEKMWYLDSVVMGSVKAMRVPAGSALAMDRQAFSRRIIEQLKQHPLIEVVQEEVTQVPDDPCIIASGPLTGNALSKAIQEHAHADYFHFYDAAVPIIKEDSVDFSKAHIKSRHDKGEAVYVDCVTSREEFDAFYKELIHTETAQLHKFGDEIYFEGCILFEETARRGRQILLFGLVKPIGPECPGGTTPYAIVQLRQDNAVASLYNIVGSRTHLKWGEQKCLLSMIPGLENISTVRYGVMYRNSYLCAPKVLCLTYQHVQRDDPFFAGQPCGVENYVESAANGLLVGMSMANLMCEKAVAKSLNTCVIGSTTHYTAHASERYFQLVNVNFGITRLLEKIKKKERKEAFTNQMLSVIGTYKKEFD